MALALAVNELQNTGDVTVDLIDPGTMDLPFPGEEQHSEVTLHLQQRVAQVDAVLIATPGYHGSFSSVTKLVIENLGFPSVLKGKPVALLGTASGAAGAITALEHLRSVCSHVGAIVLPGEVSVARVHKAFDESGRCSDPAVEKAIRGVAQNLRDYVRLCAASRSL
jgi:NAD(P)H-dependent FMN reductase